VIRLIIPPDRCLDHLATRVISPLPRRVPSRQTDQRVKRLHLGIEPCDLHIPRRTPTTTTPIRFHDMHPSPPHNPIEKQSMLVSRVLSQLVSLPQQQTITLTYLTSPHTHPRLACFRYFDYYMVDRLTISLSSIAVSTRRFRDPMDAYDTLGEVDVAAKVTPIRCSVAGDRARWRRRRLLRNR
jgi:hypothetical protein